MKSKSLAFIIFSFLVLSLTACGFHLRGYNPTINQHPIIIINQTPFTDISEPLAEQLKFAGFKVITPPVTGNSNGMQFSFTHIPEVAEIILPEDTYVLRILAARPTKMRMSGRYSEIRIGLTVDYQLDVLDPKVPAIVPESRMESFRNYQFDLLSINSEGQQEAVYRIDLVKDVVSQLIQQMVFQLRAKLANPVPL